MRENEWLGWKKKWTYIFFNFIWLNKYFYEKQNVPLTL